MLVIDRLQNYAIPDRDKGLCCALENILQQSCFVIMPAPGY